MYLLIINEAGNLGDQTTHSLFQTIDQAKKAFKDVAENFIKQTIFDEGLTKSEAKQYRKECYEADTTHDLILSCVDTNLEWGVYLRAIKVKGEK